jgi:hypothetical protein
MKICSQCKQEKNETEFTLRKASRDGLTASCKKCKQQLDTAVYQKHRSKRIEYVKSHTAKNQAIIGQLKIDTGCQMCGLKDSRPWLFDFDHLGDKTRLVSRMMSHKIGDIIAETKKCQVLCSNCHRTITYQRVYGTIDPVTPKKCLRVPVFMRNWKVLLNFKKNPCMDCGKSFHFAAMDCDHRDPKTKLGEPSNMSKGHEAKFLAELAKCDVVCSNCHRIRNNSRHIPNNTLSIREQAKQLMVESTGLSYQKAIRDVIAKIEGPKQNAPVTMEGAYVTKISNQQAGEIILKYEWLGTMGRPQSCYGLWFNIDGIPSLAGVVCFGFATGRQASNVCGKENAKLAIALERGACVYWAPKNAASWFLPKAMALASKEKGWKIFFAYSDPAANELGTIYQACNWIYLGIGPGHGPTREVWTKPNGVKVTSRALRFQKLTTKQAIAAGWKKKIVPSRGKYVWFEGNYKFKQAMKKALIHPPVKYPKRKPLPFNQL